MGKLNDRIGQIVPSSNTTMETTIPATLRARERIERERFAFHSRRMRMKKVTKEELAAMDADSGRCALELSDARVDVLGHARPVAIMSMGRGDHRVSEQRLHGRTVENGAPTLVGTIAGALIHGLRTIGAKEIARLAPFMKPLTALVVDYIEHEGFEVLDCIALQIPDNLEVGARDPRAPIEISKRRSTANCDAAVRSACVQMPSLASIHPVEDRIGLPVLAAAVGTTFQILRTLKLNTLAPLAGALRSGRY